MSQWASCARMRVVWVNLLKLVDFGRAMSLCAQCAARTRLLRIINKQNGKLLTPYASCNLIIYGLWHSESN
jgi:hypothetical protein